MKTISENRSQRRRVLIVDDEALVCWSIQNRLTKEGYYVDISHDAEEALSKISQSKFDIVITDYKLPVKDGCEVAKAAKAINPLSFIVMISAYGDRDARIRAKEIGIEFFIDKPFDLAVIVKVVNELSKRKGIDEVVI